MMSLPPPLQPLQCDHEDCTLPSGGTCALVAEIDDPERECPHLRRQTAGDAESQPEPAAPVTEERGQDARVSRDAAPWSGRHLDPATTDLLLWRSPARLIAVAGPHNAGKTSLLASFFLQLANGQCRGLPYRFASSRTLYGFHGLLDRIQAWENAATRRERDTASHELAIVGRTPKEEGPARFLHLGLCPGNPSDRRHVDVLLSDAAGEWSSNFTRHADADMKKHMAFMGRCDGFIVVADAAALLDPAGRIVDAEISRTIRRLADTVKGASLRPRALALVLSKYDLVVRDALPPEGAEKRRERDAWGVLGKRCTKIWNALRYAGDQGLPWNVFPVSAFPGPLAKGQPVGVEAPFAFVLEHADERAPWGKRSVPVPRSASSFLAMRRWSELPGPDGREGGWS